MMNRTYVSIAMMLLASHLGSPFVNTNKDQDSAVTKSFTEPIETITVAAIETGVIQTVRVQEGDRVNAGDQLAILNSEVLVETRRRAVAQSESTAVQDAAQARVEMLKSQKENLQKLFPGGHVNQHELDQKTSEYRTALAELKKAKDDLVLARIEVDRINAQLKQRVISSPINGFVTKIHKKIGEQVSNNEPQYATIVRIDQLKARFYLDAQTLDQLQIGSSVTVTVGKPGKIITGSVLYVSPIIDPDSGTGRVEILLQNSDYKIRSGSICYFGVNDEQGNDIANARSNLSRRKNIK